MTNHEPWEYQTHITDEWERDTMVVQVRQMHRGHTAAIGQVLEDRDGMAVMDFRRLPDTYDGREHLEPTPGLRLRHDVAVSMARAILTDAGKDADEVERLKAQVDTLHAKARSMGALLDEARAERDLAKREVEMLELLVEAKDAHLEREARTATVFVRGLEMHQGTAEVEAERANHPTQTLSEHVRRAMGRMD